MKSCWISCSCWEVSSFKKLILEIGASSLGLPRLPQTSHTCGLGSQCQCDLVRGLHCHSRSTGILQTFATSGVIRLTTPTMHYHKGNALMLPYLCIVWSPQHGSHLMTPALGTFLSFSPEFSEIWATTPASSGWDPYPNGGHLYWTLFKGHGNKPSKFGSPGRTWHFPGISLLFPLQSEFFSKFLSNLWYGIFTSRKFLLFLQQLCFSVGICEMKKSILITDMYILYMLSIHSLNAP